MFRLLPFLLFALRAFSQTCSKTSRCEIGCCNSNGFCGFGPDFCGDKCISDCDRRSECNPGFGSKWAQKDKCPLNVCCSKYGFCGTTKDFCGNKQVKRPSCSKSNGLARVIGYYEGWSTTQRPCSQFYPEQIPIGVYTTINFAFATIDPKTFEVRPADSSDPQMYKRVALLKQKDPDLKVFIAIGGWTFSDPGPTRTTFSDLAASVPRQKAFFKSLTTFMATYDFDGVDIDWEYPEADDRAGRPIDYANFPKFIHNLRGALSGTGGRDGISVTLPASYWYLQHFDLQALSKDVSWFNVMSYDLHGTWDRGNKWVGNFLNAHTNLTEIDLAMDLIWRNNIKPDQVVLGMAFYGRAFTATSSSCTEPGCTFESGAEKGPCSKEISILLNSEIDDIVAKNKIKPKLYKDAAVKVATWKNQWVAYDDEDTFKMKTEYAQEKCLGGVMVWAISHDTQDAKYSKALAKVTNRKFIALSDHDGSGDPTQKVDTKHDQCKWTNCGEMCPSGWVLMTREDSGARGKEYMFDESGCDGDGVHRFCCPADSKLPTCGWYTHHNGKCDPQCPSGTIEIGSNSKYCNNNKYQAACCTFNTDSMRLYSNCEWGQWPMCNALDKCPWINSLKDELIASSTTGTGGAECNLWSYDPKSRTYTVQERKYCCDHPSDKEVWSDCDWYDNYGLAAAGRTEDNFCRSGCPPDRIRVAMDRYGGTCYGKGGSRARCCVPKFSTTKDVENPVLGQYRDDLKAYLNNPQCKNPSGFWKREISSTSNHEVANETTEQELVRRDPSSDPEKKVEQLLLILLTAAASKPMLDAEGKIWDDGIGSKFPNLKLDNLKKWLPSLPSWKIDGPIDTVHRLVCNMYYFNGLAGSDRQKQIVCDDEMCTLDGYYCNSDETIKKKKRGIFLFDSLLNARDNATINNDDYWQDLPAEGEHMNYLTKRASAKDYQVTFTDENGNSYSIIVTAPAYDSPSQIDSDNPIFDEAVDVESVGDCTNPRVARFSLPNMRYYQIEHLIDRNTIGRFITDAAAGRLPSGAGANTPRVSATFFRQARNNPLLPNAPPLPGGFNTPYPYDRVMECLGSTTNTANFVLTQRDINQFKNNLWQFQDPVTLTKMTAHIQNTGQPEFALLNIRQAVTLFEYLNHQGTPNVNQRLMNVANDITDQWRLIENAWNAIPGNPQVRLADFWREWLRDFFRELGRYTRDWANTQVTNMRHIWGVRTGDYANQVLQILDVLENLIPNLNVDASGFH